ncbi:hypothetical protein AAE478_002627 [Parahypoxylon ruwenzoriense]
MAIDVEELIIQPFREVAERGKDAIANAEAAASGDSDGNGADGDSKRHVTGMLKSARSLVREGERALQRLLPLWKGQVDKYGDTFTEAMRQNEQIIDSQRRLDDLLYDLDDFVEIDSFDAGRFAEVQAASKAFALTLMETIMRLHLEENIPTSSASPDPSQMQSSLPQIPNGTGAISPMVASEIADFGTITPARRPSSPDILGAERDCISLVSTPTSPTFPPATSRTSAWVNEQTTAARTWPATNSIPEDDCFVTHPVISNNLDTVALRGPDVSKPFNVPYSPETTYSRISWYTSTGSYVSGPKSISNVPTSDQRTTSLAKPMLNTSETREPKDLDSPPPPTPPVYEDGLILTNELFAQNSNSSSGYQIGLDSSLYLQKGLCPGAQAFRVKGRKNATRSVMEYGTRRSVARCAECEFAQSLLEVELDDGQDSSGNFCKAGVLYRLRFLYKSHLVSSSAFTMQFGCLFCAQKGHTVYADDATVFSTPDQLFQHLSRHPQPLPEIPGVVVLYGQVPKDDPRVEDYDLHFPNPPAASLLPDAAALAKLPSAVAVRSHVKRYGREVIDPDGNSDQVLKFLEGARIVGIEFPERWKGKWCVGWHDGLWGGFPAKNIVLEAPAHLPGAGAGAGAGADGMFVTTRWKCDVKDTAAGWLPFDKDETLSNVSWLNQDDWCWFGMKKNGKVGIFPRSHVKMESLRRSAVWHGDGEDEDSLQKIKKQSFTYNKWHETELERWLSDNDIPYPTPADRKDLEDLIRKHWDSYAVAPYKNWDVDKLEAYLESKGVEAKESAKSNKDSLVSEVANTWYEIEDKAQSAWQNVHDWILDTWSESALKAFADKHGIPVPQPRTRDTLLQKIRSNYETVAKKAGETAAYPGDWLYDVWSESDLKEWLDTHGFPAPQITDRNKLIAMVRRNSRLAYLRMQDQKASVSASISAAYATLTEKMIDAWGESRLKEFCDKNGINVPQGSKVNELRALVRKHRSDVLGDSLSASVTSAYGAATSKAGNEYARASNDASLAAQDAFNTAVETWSESRLKAYLDARGIPVPQGSKTDELRALVRRNSHKAAHPYSAWTWDDFSYDNLRDYLAKSGNAAAKKIGESSSATRDDLVEAAHSLYTSASSAGGDSYASATSYLAQATEAVKKSAFDTWSESELKAYLDSYGIPAPQGSTINKLRAEARKQSAYFKYGTTSPAETVFAKLTENVKSAYQWVLDHLSAGSEAAKKKAGDFKEEL